MINLRRKRSIRRGVSTVEMITVLIVLILVTLVSFQFGTALIVKQTVSHAATVAAREAGKGADLAELTDDINRVLLPHGIQLGAEASFVLENPLPQPQVGTLPCEPPVTPVLDGDEVRVTVCLSLSAPPILNVLETYGVDFAGKKFTISSVATRE